MYLFLEVEDEECKPDLTGLRIGPLFFRVEIDDT